MCPGCASLVMQQLNARMLPLLVSAGCVVENTFPSEDEGARRAVASPRPLAPPVMTDEEPVISMPGDY